MEISAPSAASHGASSSSWMMFAPSTSKSGWLARRMLRKRSPPFFVATGDAEFLPVLDAGGNLDLMRLGAAVVLDGDGADRRRETPLRASPKYRPRRRGHGWKIRRTRRTAASARAEELLEKTAEAVLPNSNSWLPRGRAIILCVAEAAEAGRARNSAPDFQFAPSSSYLRRLGCRKELVGFVDFLEFLLGLFFVLRHVGVMFAGEFCEKPF